MAGRKILRFAQDDKGEVQDDKGEAEDDKGEAEDGSITVLFGGFDAIQSNLENSSFNSDKHFNVTFATFSDCIHYLC